MRLLLVTNMFPSAESPYAGVFVKNQYDFLCRILDPRPDIFYMKRTFTSPFGSLVKYLIAFARFIPLLFREYDILHIHYFFPLSAFAYLYKLFHPAARIVVTFHGGDVTTDMRGSMRMQFFSAVARSVDYSIAVDLELVKPIKEKLHLRADRLLSAGVDRRTYYRIPGVKKTYDFLFVGSLIQQKGIDIMIEAVRLLDDKSIRFCFVGNGPYYQEVLKLCSAYDVTVMNGKSQPELCRIYNQSRFFLFPMRQEGIGLVTREALCCGLPVIVPPHEGMKHVIKEGVNGFFLSELTPGEVSAKARMAMNIDENAYAAMSEQAVTLSEEHSLDYVCRELKEIYKSLCNLHS